MSILSNGPNNQLVDFRNSILFAIKLNRTLVIPTFFEHFTIRNMVHITFNRASSYIDSINTGEP